MANVQLQTITINYTTTSIADELLTYINMAPSAATSSSSGTGDYPTEVIATGPVTIDALTAVKP